MFSIKHNLNIIEEVVCDPATKRTGLISHTTVCYI